MKLEHLVQSLVILTLTKKVRTVLEKHRFTDGWSWVEQQPTGVCN